MTTKSIPIKGTGSKFVSCALNAIELTSGDLPFVVERRLRVGRPVLTGRQKPAEGIVCMEVQKARTVLHMEGKGIGE